MKPTEVRVFAVRGHAGNPSPAWTRSASHHFCFEVQWQDRRGRFHHLAVKPLGSRRVLWTAGATVLGMLAVIAACSPGSRSAQGSSRTDRIAHENQALKTHHEALRERADELAEQLYRRVEDGRRLARMRGAPVHAWVAPPPSPPARNTGDEVVLAWLSEQGAWLEAIGEALAADQLELNPRQASSPATANREVAGGRNGSPLEATELLSGKHQPTTLVRR